MLAAALSLCGGARAQSSGGGGPLGFLDGIFTGWRGHTVFKLENGQEWTQQESGSFDNGKYDHPAVKIKPMILGSWLLSVESCGCSVRVTRTK